MSNRTAIIVYPREYKIVEGEKTGNGHDYVIGVDDENNPVKVILEYSRDEIAKTYEDKAIKHTSIAMLADTKRKAPRSAIATDDNGPDNPCGIILFERLVSPDFNPKKHKEGDEVPQFKLEGEMRVYKSGWANRICMDDIDYEEHPPEMGVGYVQMQGYGVSKNDPEREEKMERLAIMNNERDELRLRILKTPKGPDRDLMKHDLEQLQNDIDTMINYRVSLVSVKPELMETIKPKSREEVLEAYARLAEPLTNTGRYGGVLLRVRSGDRVVHEMCREICMKYKDRDENKNVIISKPEDDFAEFIKFHKGGKILNEAIKRGLEVDLIPIQKINSGPEGIARFNKVKGDVKPEIIKIRRTYENPLTGDILARNFYASISKSVDGQDSDLLGRVHATSEALPSPFLLTKEKDKYLKFHYLNPLPKVEEVQKDKVSGIENNVP